MRIECENCNAAYTIGDALLSDQPIGAQCPYCGHVRIVRKGDPPSVGRKSAAPPPPSSGGGGLSLGLNSRPPPPPPASARPGPGLGGLGGPPSGGGLGGPAPIGRIGLGSNVDISDLGAPTSPSAGPFSDRFAPPPPAPSSPGATGASARCQVCGTELTDEFDKVIGLCETHQRERSGQPDFGASTDTRAWRVRALDGTVQGPLSLAELKAGLEENRFGEEDEFSRDGGDYMPMDRFHELRSYTRAERGLATPRATALSSRPRASAAAVRRDGGGVGFGTVMLSLLVLGLAAGGAYLMMHPELMQGVLGALPSSQARIERGAIPPNPLKRHLEKWRLAHPDASGTADEHLASAQARMLEDTPMGHQQAQDALQRALLLDEDNAVAASAYAENLILWKGGLLTEEELALVDGATRFAAAAKPDDALALRGRAAYALITGDLNAARTAAERVLALAPKDGLARLYMASSFLEGNPPLAAREAEAAVAAQPALRRSDRVLARAFANAGRYGSAMKVLDRRLSNEPGSGATAWLKAELEAELARYDNARKLYTQAMAGQGDDVGPRIALGELLLRLGDARGATEAYRPIVEGSRPLPVKYRLAALAGLARAELSFGRAPRVRELASAALQLDPRDPAATLALAEVALAAGSSTTAEAYAEKVLAARPGEPAALVVVGRAALMRKQTERGIQKLEEATQNDPHDIVVRGVLAGAYLSMGGNVQAFTLMRRAAELDPADIDTRARRGLFGLSEAAVNEALERFRESSKDLPDRSVALSSAAMVLYQLGRPGEARPLLAQALEADDANAGALLYSAQLALDRGAPGEAEELARRIFRVERGSAIGWLTVGRAQLAQKQAKAAIESFDTALRSQKGLLVAEVERAAARLALGEKEEARRALSSAHDRNPHLVRTRRLLLEIGE